jgi:hypothetical protein
MYPRNSLLYDLYEPPRPLDFFINKKINNLLREIPLRKTLAFFTVPAKSGLNENNYTEKRGKKV